MQIRGVGKLEHPNKPPPIFSNNLTTYDTSGTDIVPTNNTTGDQGLQLQLHHRKWQGDKYVYTTTLLGQM